MITHTLNYHAPLCMRLMWAQVQSEAASATGRAVEAERVVAERIAHVNKELHTQLAAVERAYEEFRRVERQRTKEALGEAASLSKCGAGGMRLRPGCMQCWDAKLH